MSVLLRLHRLRRAFTAKTRRLLCVLLLRVSALPTDSGWRITDMPSGLMEEIRPGVYRPDWSVVTKPAARSALIDRGKIRSGFTEKWARRLPPKEDLAWRIVLEAFASSGRPPSVLKIAEKIGLPDGEARTLLVDLRAHDLLGLDESATKITYAYP